MGFGGAEWMKDWYERDYYKVSPAHNPQGPDSGEKRVARGSHHVSIGTRAQMTVYRAKRHPLEKYSYWGSLVRCVVNSPKPVQR